MMPGGNSERLRKFRRRFIFFEGYPAPDSTQYSLPGAALYVGLLPERVVKAFSKVLSSITPRAPMAFSHRKLMFLSLIHI